MTPIRTIIRHAPKAVLFCGLALSWLVFVLLSDRDQRLEQTRFDNAVEETERFLQNYMDRYVEALRGGAGLLQASQSTVTNEEWRTYVETLDIVGRHPGLRGIGVVKIVKNQDLDAYAAERKKDAAPEFRVHKVPHIEQRPQTDFAFPIHFIEPLDRNGPALGLDLASESNRFRAADIARNTGQPRSTQEIILVQDAEKRPGFLIYLPVYRHGAAPTSLEERHAAFQFFIYSPLVSEEFFAGARGNMSEQDREIGFTVFNDSPNAESKRIFGTSESKSDQEFDRITTIDLYGIPFTVGWQKGPDFSSGNPLGAGWITLITGILAVGATLLFRTMKMTHSKAQAIAEDLTETLNQSEKRFEAALEAAPNGIVMIDQRGTIVLANQETEKIFGYTRKELLGLRIDDLVPEDRRAGHPEHRRNFMANPMRRSMSDYENIAGRHKDGTTIPLAVGLMPLQFDDKIFVVGGIIDITKKAEADRRLRSALETQKALINDLEKLMLEAESANKAKSTFLANMSHEIRTPMNSVLGMAELLERTELNKDQRAYVRILQKAGDSMLQLINSILDLAKVESGKVEAASDPFDLDDLLNSCIEVMTVPAERKGLDLQLIKNPELPRIVQGDPQILRQVFINLIGNSVKFTKEGGVEVRAEITRSTPEQMTIEFCVEDSGIGIAEDDYGKLFRRFTQLDATAELGYGGTGLGLALCDRLVRLMGGTIGVDSAPGVGSTFRFTVQFKRTEQDVDFEVTSQSQPTSMFSEREPIILPRDVLVVDDTADNRILVDCFLKDTDVRLEFAKNGKEGVEKAKNYPYDVILMDMQMPVMDGYAATRALRVIEENSGRQPVRIIACTASALAEDRDRALQAGCDLHLSKPISRRSLLEALAGNQNDSKPNADSNQFLASHLGESYLSNKAELTTRIAEAADAGDLAFVATESHKLKGSGASYGFPAITEAAALLNRAAKNKEAERSKELARELQALVFEIIHQRNVLS